MKLTDTQLQQAKVLAESDPIVKALLDHYNFVTGSQVYDSYVARLLVLQKWNEDLITNPISIISDKKVKKSEEKDEVDKKDKEVDRILKFMEKQPDLIEGTESMRAKLLPHEQEALIKEKRLANSPDLAFG